MAHTITATFSLNTPLFAGGAVTTTSELRVSEIKAALRFWWRALNCACYAEDRDAFGATESQLFGGAGKGQGQGVLVTMAPDDKKTELLT